MRRSPSAMAKSRIFAGFPACRKRYAHACTGVDVDDMGRRGEPALIALDFEVSSVPFSSAFRASVTAVAADFRDPARQAGVTGSVRCVVATKAVAQHRSLVFVVAHGATIPERPQFPATPATTHFAPDF